MTGRPFPDPEAEARFYEMAGRCIAAWAKVDDELFRIFHSCVGGHRKQCAIVYFRLSGLGIRFGITGDVVESISGRADWSKAASGFADLLRVRTRIAHQHVAARVEWDALDIFPPFGELPLSGYHSEHWFEVAEGPHRESRGKSNPPLVVADLEAHLADVTRLASALREFCDDTLPALLPKSL